MGGSKYISKKAFPINAKMIAKSPFKGNEALVKKKIQQYNNKLTRMSVGFTFRSSLKSMGLIPRDNDLYMIGEKYRRFI